MSDLIRVLDHNWPAFEKKFRRIERAAKKLGLEIPTYEIASEGSYKHEGRIVRYRMVRVTGDAPKIEGFSFLGKVEPSPVEGVNLIKSVPGLDDDLSKFRTVALDCEHCQKPRARRHIFIVRDDETRSLHVVGKTCLKDFTGHDSPESVAMYSTVLDDLKGDDGWESMGSYRPIWDITQFVEMSAAIIEENGFSPSGTPQSTSYLVPAALSGCAPFAGDDALQIPEIKQHHKDTAASALSWIRSLSTDETQNTNNYLLNLRLACGGEGVELGSCGLVASLLTAHARHLGQAEKKKEIAKEKDEAKDIPEFDGRTQIDGKVVALKWKETDFGDTLKMVVKHSDGWALWGTVPRSLGWTEEKLIGKQIRFVARVDVSDNDKKFGFFNRPTKAEFVDTTAASTAS